MVVKVRVGEGKERRGVSVCVGSGELKFFGRKSLFMSLRRFFGWVRWSFLKLIFVYFFFWKGVSILIIIIF